MADEASVQSNVQEPPAAAPATPSAAPAVPEDGTSFRDQPAFKAVTKQVEDERAKATALQAQLDEILNKDKEAKEAAELKALEDAADYKTIMSKKDAEIEALTKAHTRAMVESSLKVALLSAGAVNDVFLDGATARYTGDAEGIGKYVDGLKAAESNAAFFGIVEAAPQQGIPAAQGGTPASSGTVDYRQLKQDLTSGDPAKTAAASAAITKYAEDNGGALPPGF